MWLVISLILVLLPVIAFFASIVIAILVLLGVLSGWRTWRRGR